MTQQGKNYLKREKSEYVKNAGRQDVLQNVIRDVIQNRCKRTCFYTWSRMFCAHSKMEGKLYLSAEKHRVTSENEFNWERGSYYVMSAYKFNLAQIRTELTRSKKTVNT